MTIKPTIQSSRKPGKILPFPDKNEAQPEIGLANSLNPSPDIYLMGQGDRPGFLRALRAIRDATLALCMAGHQAHTDYQAHAERNRRNVERMRKNEALNDERSRLSRRAA
jgi:hypothetical protein